jgi:hypothetical protein
MVARCGVYPAIIGLFGGPYPGFGGRVTRLAEMGAHPYHYIVSYWPQPDVLFPELREPEFCIRLALDDLRCWVFLAGNYLPTDPYNWITDLFRPLEVSFEIS